MAPPPEIPALSPDAPLQRFGGPGAEAYRQIIEAQRAQYVERIAHLESVLSRIAHLEPGLIQNDHGDWNDCPTCLKAITLAAEAAQPAD